jgi:hypothetical protein
MPDQNHDRISAVSIVAECVLLIGKVTIVATSTVSAYFYLEHYFDDVLRGLHVVSILIFFLSSFSASLFSEVFAVSISTILQCFVTDEENFEVRMTTRILLYF